MSCERYYITFPILSHWPYHPGFPQCLFLITIETWDHPYVFRSSRLLLSDIVEDDTHKHVLHALKLFTSYTYFFFRMDNFKLHIALCYVICEESFFGIGRGWRTRARGGGVENESEGGEWCRVVKTTMKRAQ